MANPRGNRLPLDPRERALALVRRSSPSPDAPPLPPLPVDLEREIRSSDTDRAVLYATFDEITDRCYRLADEIESSGVVIDVIDPDDEDSLVTSIDDVMLAATHYTDH